MENDLKLSFMIICKSFSDISSPVTINQSIHGKEEENIKKGEILKVKRCFTLDTQAYYF